MQATLSGRENMSSFNASEYISYILNYKNENTSSDKGLTLIIKTMVLPGHKASDIGGCSANQSKP